MQESLVTILILACAACVLSLAGAPLLTKFLYAFNIRKRQRVSANSPIFQQMHAAKSGTPTMGGVLIWGVVYVLAIIPFAATLIAPNSFLASFNFLTRSETYLPFGALLAAAFVGLIDDLFNILGLGPTKNGLRMRDRLIVYAAISAVGAWWFYVKLGWDTLHVPFYGDVSMGWWYIPLFMFVLIATSFSVNETDGLDGLAGGTLATAFSAYAVIALLQGKNDLAALCVVIVGALFGFLWFNITPARFYMGDTGAMGLGVCLGVVAMLTNSALLLPFVGFIFVLESASVLVQIFSKKVFKRKFFMSAPIHHHFEAIGWSEAKVVMRFWIIGGIVALLGVAIAIVEPTSRSLGIG